MQYMYSCALVAALLTASTFAAGPDGVEKVQPVIPIESRPFAPGEVILLGGPFKHAQDINLKYLLELDPDRLLAPYYEAAAVQPIPVPPPTRSGDIIRPVAATNFVPQPAVPPVGRRGGAPGAISPNGKARYGGSEAVRTFIGGHMLGHWLSASSRMIAIGGNAELKTRMDKAIGELATLQAKYPTGYLGPFPEAPFTRIFAGTITVGLPPSDVLSGQRVPWYTINTLLAGLIDAHQIGGSKQALEIAVKLADWAKTGTDKLTDDQMEQMLKIEHGGISESFAQLHAITGEAKYLELSKRFAHKEILFRLSSQQDDLAGKHANSQIPKVIASARIFELTNDDYFQNIGPYFWHQVVTKRSYSIGGHGEGVNFSTLGKLPLGTATCEGCNTHNMLRLTRELLMWKQAARYADYYERALFNHILASQNPDDGTVTYFTSMKPGHFKVYSTPLDSMWCCVGTGIENPTRYTDATYTHGTDSLWVNLYMPTELNWKSKGIALRQETDFPESPNVKFTLAAVPPGEFTINLRIPSWAAGAVVAKVNGTEAGRGNAGDNWITLKRTWAAKDTIDLTLPMNLHIERALDENAGVSILYGPIVLAAEMGKEGMPADDHARTNTQFDAIPSLDPPALVTDKEEPADWLKPVEGKPLTFKTTGVGRPAELQFIPFYKLHHQRYAVYFNMLTQDAWVKRDTEIKETRRRTIDTIKMENIADEQAHRLASRGSFRGPHNGRTWRDAHDGFFSYQIKVDPEVTNILRVTYWGGEDVPRDFDILIDNTRIAEQKLSMDHPGEFFDIDYEIPLALTKGKTMVELKFQSKPGDIAGGFFGLLVLRK